MLTLGKFHARVQLQVHHNDTPLHNSISRYLHKPRLSFPIQANFRTGLCCNALKAKKRGDFSGPDEFEDEFEDGFLDLEDENDGEFFVDGEEEEEVVIPLKNMKQWLENRPRGFGEGKVYDTSIEDKLMEEIEQSREAQLANLNKLKNSSPMAPSSKKEIRKLDKG